MLPGSAPAATSDSLVASRTKLGLSKYAAEAAERAGESDGDLHLSRNVRDVAAVHSSLWPEDHNERGILNLNVLAGGGALVQIAETDKGVSE